METPLTEPLRSCKKIVVEELLDKEFSSILEVGTQWAENLIPVKEKYPDKKIVGTDIDLPTLEEAKKITGLDLIEGDILALPFKDKSFDIVFTEAVFVMLQPEQIDRALNEVIRVAKKYIILVEPHSEKLNTIKNIGWENNNRIILNYKKEIEKKGLTPDIKKIPAGLWDVGLWKEFGYIITVKL